MVLKNSDNCCDEGKTFLEKGGEKFIYSVITSNIPVLENNPQNNFLLKDRLEQQNIYSIIAVPLTIKGKNNGVLVLTNKDMDKQFTQGDLDKIITMISHSVTVLEVAMLHNEKNSLFYQTLTGLAATIDAKDSYTKGHSEKVMYYSTLIGKELGLNKREMESLKYASLLHDIGKIGIPDAVLNKPGKLNNEEFEIIKQHPNLSYYIVKDIDFLNPTLEGIRYHHERVDGKGYPEGLKGDKIPMIAKILAVADAYDAMTSKRVYSKAKTTDDGLMELKKCAGTQFDPTIVEAFIKVIKTGNSC